tara:strand:+ start:739 stop:996 length:258 start_codon:yes stop_codon:yes gene_type:complete
MPKTLPRPASVVDGAFLMASVKPTGVADKRPRSHGQEPAMAEPTMAELMAEINELKERVHHLERRVIPDRSGEYPPIFDSMSASE